jgi:Restriction endonuclease AspBHI N-terminal
MADERAVGFSELATADLVLERIYKGGSAGHAGDDPLGRLLPGVGNQGGFRRLVRLRTRSSLSCCTPLGAEPDWPDALDPHTGTFTYFGDNRLPGRDLHDTPRRGNQLLRDAFERAAAGPDGRAQVPPFFLFDKPGTGRDLRFRGLLAPGSGLLGSGEDLIAIWRTARGQRFQNYRARFTLLDVHTVPRSWIEQLRAGEPLGGPCPPTWRTWVQAGAYTPLLAPSTVKIRVQGGAARES